MPIINQAQAKKIREEQNRQQIAERDAKREAQKKAKQKFKEEKERKAKVSADFTASQGGSRSRANGGLSLGDLQLVADARARREGRPQRLIPEIIGTGIFSERQEQERPQREAEAQALTQTEEAKGKVGEALEVGAEQQAQPVTTEQPLSTELPIEQLSQEQLPIEQQPAPITEGFGTAVTKDGTIYKLTGNPSVDHANRVGLEAIGKQNQQFIDSLDEGEKEVLANAIAVTGGLSVIGFGLVSTGIKIARSQIAVNTASKVNTATAVKSTGILSRAINSLGLGKGTTGAIKFGAGFFGVSKIVGTPDAIIRSSDTAMGQIRETLSTYAPAVRNGAMTGVEALEALDAQADAIRDFQRSINFWQSISLTARLNPEFTTSAEIRAIKLLEIIELERQNVLVAIANPENPQLTELNNILKELESKEGSFGSSFGELTEAELNAIPIGERGEPMFPMV